MFSIFLCDKKNEDGLLCCVPTPYYPIDLSITFWDSLSNVPYLNSVLILQFSFIIIKKNVTENNFIQMYQACKNNKYKNYFNLNRAAKTSIQDSIKTYYIVFSDGNIDTLFIDYKADSIKKTLPLVKFLYNNKVPKYDNVFGLFIINK